MRAISVYDAFVPVGCEDLTAPKPAVTVEAGAIWAQVYDAVTTKSGQYVQGGGCMTVGVAGLISSGGFGSFSKAYGMAACTLLEAEVIGGRYGPDRQRVHPSRLILGDQRRGRG